MPRFFFVLALASLTPAGALAEPEAQADKPALNPIDEAAAAAGAAPAGTSAEIPETPVSTAQAAASDRQFERAAPHIERGEALFEAGNYGAALAEFERAYELLDGHEKRYQTLYNIALCHQRLFRYDRAMRYLRRYLQEGGEEASDHAVVEAAIESLEGLLGTLRVAVNTNAEVWVDDRLAGEAPGDVLVPGGSHSVELRAPGYEPDKQEVNVPARATRSLEVRLRPIPRSKGLSPIYFFIAGGLAVGAAATGAVFGVGALSKADDNERRAGDPQERPKLTPPDGEEAGDRALTADLFYLAAGALAITSAVLFFMTDWEGGEGDAPKVAAAIGPSGGMLRVRGTL